MARVNRGQEEAFGNDSFLDVVANIVGILIILVVVASMRIKHLPSLLSPELRSREKATEALADAQSSMAALEQDILDQSAEMQKVAIATAGRYQERAVLAQIVAQRQHELEQKRSALGGASREQFDLEQSLAMSQAKLTQIAQAKQQLDTSPAPTIEIKTYPTPISQTVYGKEMHFQLKGGLITPVPLDALLEKFKRRVPEQTDRLRDERQFTDSVGPIDGFRLKYTVERVDLTDAGHSGSYAQLRQFTLIPMSDDLGESIDEAASAQSRFSTALAGLAPKRTTVTLWTYEDSFPIFREVRKYLHERGFSVAGRPLAHGQPIAGSPHGSKSASQ
jgi:multidrug efflux pump subunit AcrA (membrane-fusion protein)